MVKRLLLLLAFLITFFFLFFVFPVKALATTYYVAGDIGDDNNPGTESEPWATVQKAADTMVAGDTVNVKGEITYNETIDPANSGTPGNYITYQNWEGTGIPLLTSAGLGYLMNSDGDDYFIFSGFHMQAGNYIKIINISHSDYVIFRNNIFSDVDLPIYGLLNTNIKIYNNVFYNGYNAISCVLASDYDIKNNIISNYENAGIYVHETSSSITIDYNDVWDSGIGYEGCSAGDHDISQDPLFVDPDNDDFQLQSDSPCIDTGTTLSEVPKDILGVTRPQLSGYDMGAYEFSDTESPLISLTALSPDPNNDNTPSLTGTATDTIGTVSSVEYQMDGIAGSSWIACTADDGSFGESSEAFTCNVSSALSDGSHTIYVRATDSNGNTTSSGSESSDTFTIDTTNPTISLTAYTPDPGNDNTPSVTGTATDATTVLTAIQYQVDFTSGTWSSCTADNGAIDETSEAFTCTASPALSDGSHTIYVRATDNASNTTSASSYGTDSFTIDTVAPTTPDLLSPEGYTKNHTQPTLSFKKATDATSGISSYTVELDSGKNKSYSTSGIPASGDGSSSYIWKDDSVVKVKFLNENDADSTNDEIHVYFKGLNNSELTEGKHSWKVTVSDQAGNSTTVSRDFYLDRTSPSFSELAIANLFIVSQGGVYRLVITNRMPSFSGKAFDSYQGSEKSNDNGTKDTFEKVSSGPDKITLDIKKLNEGGNPNFDSPQYTHYLAQEYSLTDIKDDPNNQKHTRFYLTTPFPLKDGYYQVNLSLKDRAGNTCEHSAFYLSLNYLKPAFSLLTNFGGLFGQDKLKTEIIEEEKIPAETEEEKERIAEEGYTVKIKVVDENKQPVKGVKVALFKEPKGVVTDDAGVVLFENVQPGEHTIKITYKSKTGEQKVNLEGEFKGFEFTIKLKDTSSFFSFPAILIISFLLLVTGSLLFLLWRKREKTVGTEDN